MSWSAAQYTKFEDERTRPVRDLLAQVPNTDTRVAIDIGCGPGNSTELLQARFPAALITGIDSSTDMIAASRERLPGIRFDVDDITAWSTSASSSGCYDVILANAALHWVPNHELVLPALITKLTPGGTLAVQIPDNLEEPAHRLMREVAGEGPWAAKLAGASDGREIRRSPEWYFRLLSAHSTRVDIWRTTYHHPLAGGAVAVTEWFKGSGLRPFLDRLDAEERAGFLSRYTESIAQAYPAFPDGIVLLPFPRLFFVATR